MAQIFISYAREDFQQARTLYQQLKAEGFSPWMDKVDLIGGQQWQPAIEKAIRQAEFFLLLLSRNSVKKRGFVQREIRAALDLWKDKLEDDVYLIPLMLEAMAGEEVPTEVSKFQWIDLYEAEGWEQLQRSLELGLAQRGLEKKPVIVPPPPITPAALIEPVRPKPQPVIVNLKAGVKLELLPIPGGAFDMGSNDYDEEKPIHSVSISPFYLGKFQITQAQWQAVMGNNPSEFKGELLPVDNVSWEEGKAFCEKLSEKTGESFRLPTEAEWEYACRAGNTVNNAVALDDMAWYGNNSGETVIDAWELFQQLKPQAYIERLKQNGNKTHPVGQKQSNQFGLFDMLGNVWEWCEDDWHKNYEGAPNNGLAWLSNPHQNKKVLRGGAWDSITMYVGSATRYECDPSIPNKHFGLRVALSAKTS